MKGRTWSETVKGEKKKNLFAILDGKDELFVGSVGSQSDLEGWKKDLTDAFTKDHADAPEIEGGEKRKKQTVAMKMKKGAASKTAKSAVGKRVC